MTRSSLSPTMLGMITVLTLVPLILATAPSCRSDLPVPAFAPPNAGSTTGLA